MLNDKLHVVVLCLLSVNVMFTSLCFVDSQIQKIILLLKNLFFLKEVPLNTPQEKEKRKEKEEGRKERKNRKSRLLCHF